MKDFFKNKLNIALSIVVLVIVGLAIFLLLNVFGVSFSKSIEAIDFSTYNKTQVEEWVKENKLKDGVYSFTYEYNDTIEKDYVIYQSVKAGDKITDVLSIIYSNGKDPSGKIDMPTITSSTTEEEVESFLNTNGFTNIIYVYQTSDTVAFGNVISINPTSASQEETVTVTVSQGKNIDDISVEVPYFKEYTKEQITRWANKYAVELKFTYETSDSAKEDEYLSQSPVAGKTINGGDNLTIVLSSGQSSSSSTTTATIPDGPYLGLSESDFLAKLKELGFTNTKKSSTTYYSETLDKNSVYSYDDGTFPTTRTINYALCEGKYTFSASNYNGLTQDNAKKKVTDEANRNARVSGTKLSINFTSGDTTGTEGNTYDCSISGATISCKVYGGSNSNSSSTTTATIPDGPYLGLSESDFLAKLKALGFNNTSKSSTTYYSTKLASGTIYSYDDGTFSTDRTINYALSAGAYTFNKSNYEGLTQDAARSKVSDEVKRNANSGNLNIKFANGDASSDNEGKTYSCSYSGATITCKVYTKKNEEPTNPTTTKASIGTANSIISFYSKSTYADAEKAVRAGLSSFNYVDVKGVSSDWSAGTIVSVSVNGNKDYAAGEYDVNTPIVVEISNGN